MSNSAHRPAKPEPGVDDFSIAFFGRRCQFTAIPFQRLATCGVTVRAIFLSSSAPSGPPLRLRPTRSTIPLFTGPNDHSTVDVVRIAREHGIPLYDLQRPLAGELERALADLAPDLLVVSCFPWRIPGRISGQAALGAINLHPSLLPQLRGPDPLFRAYLRGDSSTGVTVHQINDSLDSGAILDQRSLPIPDELPGDQLEAQAAEIGAELLVETIHRFIHGGLDPHAQDELSASYDSWPSPAELIVQPSWSIQHALNFITGIRPLGYEPVIETTTGRFEIRGARRACNSATASTAESWPDEQTVRVRFEDGVLDVSIGRRVGDE